MEEEFYHNDFEALIKDKADQYRMYPSDKVWKGIDRSLRTRRRWYWSGFVILLSGVSYLAVTELMSPAQPVSIGSIATPVPVSQPISADQLNPFTADIIQDDEGLTPAGAETVTSDLLIEDSGSITASFEIPLRYLPGNASAGSAQKAAFLISGLEPLNNHEAYNIELSWPIDSFDVQSDMGTRTDKTGRVTLTPKSQPRNTEKLSINWFGDHAGLKIPVTAPKRISWQLAFSPTVNYRKLTGGSSAKLLSRSQNIPLALNINGNVEELVNHKPALGFELGTHGFLHLSKRVILKGGLQFNYSKYDIRAFRAPSELATIALNSQVSNGPPSSLVSYTNIRNFGGSQVQDLKNQYYQLSIPLGFEVRVFGNERLQFNIASTVQPTYLINRNTYLITTDYKNYTQAPSLVRRWNVNVGAEAFISYTRGDVKWQVGPQFRHQLLSSYQNEYPIKEYLMEYGIKVGITKTIR